MCDKKDPRERQAAMTELEKGTWSRRFTDRPERMVRLQLRWPTPDFPATTPEPVRDEPAPPASVAFSAATGAPDPEMDRLLRDTSRPVADRVHELCWRLKVPGYEQVQAVVIGPRPWFSPGSDDARVVYVPADPPVGGNAPFDVLLLVLRAVAQQRQEGFLTWQEELDVTVRLIHSIPAG